MQRLGVLGVAAMAILTAQPYSAEARETSRREAACAQTTAVSLEAAIGDVSWTCVGDRCVGTGPKRLDSMMKDCRRVAAAIGPLQTFERSGRRLTPRQVAACNRLAGEAGYVLAGGAGPR